MNKALLIPALAGLVIVAGCSNGPRPPRMAAPAPAGAELYGKSIRVESGGRTSVMTFRRDGKVDATFNGRTLTGNWEVGGQRLCFTWSGFRDCWPYAGLWRRGVATSLKSERGTAVRLTLL